MQSFTILIILFAVILLYMRIETSFLQKNIINCSINSSGLRIAHLSDIHISKLYISNDRIIKALKTSNPDIIVLTGDYIERQKNIPEFIRLLKEITALCPTYLSLGNHDHAAFKKKPFDDFITLLEEAGAVVLNNSNTSIEKSGTRYNLIGIDDVRNGKPDIQKAFSGIEYNLDAKCINIAFSHNPDIVLELPKDRVDYFLCGHFHGGQIWMPFNIEFRVLRHEKLCRMGYRRGLHKINGINIYINRGLGNVIFPFRFLSVPEIAFIQLP